MIRFVDVYAKGYPWPHAVAFLYRLIQERMEEPELNISHKRMPTFQEHCDFVERRPYRCWYMIEEDGQLVGYACATFKNEIGVILSKRARGRGLGPQAINFLMSSHDPLPERSSERRGTWLANIAPGNKHSQHIFEKLGFKLIQHTYAFPEEANDGKDQSSTAGAGSA